MSPMVAFGGGSFRRKGKCPVAGQAISLAGFDDVMCRSMPCARIEYQTADDDVDALAPITADLRSRYRGNRCHVTAFHCDIMRSLCSMLA